MPALPESLDLASVGGPALPAVTVQPTDFGLGQAAAEAQNVGVMEKQTQRLQIRAQAKQDRQAAQPTVQKVLAANQEDLATAVATGKANAPGFVGDMVDIATQRANRAATDPNLTAGQQSEARVMGLAETNRVATAAADAHARAIAEPLAEAYKARQTSAVGQGLTVHQTNFGPAYQALQLGYANGDPEFLGKVGAAFDDSAGKALAATSPDAQPQLQLELANQRIKVIADAQDYALHHQVAALGHQAQTALDTLTDGVAVAPGGYDNAVSTALPQLVASFPAAMRDDIQREGAAALATARVKGLINAGQYGLADSEISAGRFNGVLKPAELEALQGETAAAARSHAPRTLDQALAQDDIRRRAGLSIQALASNGDDGGILKPGEIGGLSLEEQARYLTGANEARQLFAVVGPVREMSNADLAAAANGNPDPAQPDYAARLALKPAAAEELQRRQSDPAAWAWNTNGPKAAKAPGSGLAADRGSALEAGWQQVLTLPAGAARSQAGATYAQAMLASQQAVGLAAGSRAILPKTAAASIVAGVVNAPVEQRLAAFNQVAGLVSALPAEVKLPDGSRASPRYMLVKQLEAEHMPAIPMTAILDFADKPGALASATAAINNTTLGKPLAGGAENQLKAQVTAAMGPYLASVAPLGGSTDLAQRRLDLATLMARQGIAQGQSTGSAAQAAAAAWTSGYQMAGSVRVPQSAVPQGMFTAMGRGMMVPFPTDGVGLVKTGTDSLMTQATANNGANIYAPPGADRKHLATWLAANGRWTTTADETGAALMAPNADGTWYNVADKYGRPIRATWGQLVDQSQNRGADLFAAPANHPTGGPDAKPLPAFSRNQAFSALSQGVEQIESHGISGQISSQGAYGVMQVLPASAAPVAQRLFGQPLDMGRLLHDDDYNRQIGRQILADAVNRYGNTPGGLALAVASYHAGDANTAAMLQRYGDPRQNVGIDQWRQRIAATHPKTAQYVAAVLPAAFHYLTR